MSDIHHQAMTTPQAGKTSAGTITANTHFGQPTASSKETARFTTGAGDALPDQENVFGFRKRLQFLEQLICDSTPAKILDVGCGTGSHVTFPLAKRFPEIDFRACDSDVASIDSACRANDRSNLLFLLDSDLPAEEMFELIIASEVLEHVEDPIAFLKSLRGRLSDQGVIAVTIPNGYGPFEWDALFTVIVRLSGLYGWVSRLRGKRDQAAGGQSEDKDTLAISPHLNFFSWGGFQDTAALAGLEIERFQPRTFLCGWILGKLVRGKRRVEWNAAVSDALPAAFSSGWMFVLRKRDAPLDTRPYRRNWWARLRRRLNEQCYGSLKPADSP